MCDDDRRKKTKMNIKASKKIELGVAGCLLEPIFGSVLSKKFFSSPHLLQVKARVLAINFPTSLKSSSYGRGAAQAIARHARGLPLKRE